MPPASEQLERIKNGLADAWLPNVYAQQVLTLRTRAYQFPALPKNGKIEIHHTLLGIELQAGRKRMLCPDLATARYLSVFVRLGAGAIAIPYDITRISLVADKLESSWHRMLLISEEVTAGGSTAFRTRVRRQIIAKVRREIEELGAGPCIPQFKQSTKQRNEARRNTKGTK